MKRFPRHGWGVLCAVLLGTGCIGSRQRYLPADVEQWKVKEVGNALCILEGELQASSGGTELVSGTGVAIGPDGIVVTAWHVVEPFLFGRQENLSYANVKKSLEDRGFPGTSLEIPFKGLYFGDLMLSLGSKIKPTLIAVSWKDDLALIRLPHRTEKFLAPCPLSELPTDGTIIGLIGSGGSQFSSDKDKRNFTLGMQIKYGTLRGRDDRLPGGIPVKTVDKNGKRINDGLFLWASLSAEEGDSGGPVYTREGKLVGIQNRRSVKVLPGGMDTYVIPVFLEIVEALKADPGIHWAARLTTAVAWEERPLENP